MDIKKYTVVYTANDRYDSPIDYPTSRVEYIQGETLDEAIDEHIKHMKRWAIRPIHGCLLYTSPSPRDGLLSRMPSSA